MAKTTGKIAKRYARALLEYTPHGELKNVRDCLKVFVDSWVSNDELRDALGNPAYPLSNRSDALRAISQKFSPTAPSLQNFLVLLLQNNRLDGVEEIWKIFSSMIDELEKVLNVEVISAFEVSAAEQSEIKETMKSRFGGLATVRWETDPSLLGGLLIRSGDKQLDNSIRGSLEKVKAQILG